MKPYTYFMSTNILLLATFFFYTFRKKMRTYTFTYHVMLLSSSIEKGGMYLWILQTRVGHYKLLYFDNVRLKVMFVAVIHQKKSLPVDRTNTSGA